MMATLKFARKLHCFRAGEPAKFPGSPLGGSVLLRSSARAYLPRTPFLGQFRQEVKKPLPRGFSKLCETIGRSQRYSRAARNSFRVADNSPRTSSFASTYYLFQERA